MNFDVMHLRKLIAVAILACVPACGNQSENEQLGSLSLSGPASGTFLHFSSQGDEGNAGTFNYRGFDPHALSLVGAGTDSTSREVRIYDHLIVSGKTYISGTTASISAGAGAPTSDEQSGSIYMRTDGKLGSHMYVSSGHKRWLPVPGV